MRALLVLTGVACLADAVYGFVIGGAMKAVGVSMSSFAGRTR